MQCKTHTHTQLSTLTQQQQQQQYYNRAFYWSFFVVVGSNRNTIRRWTGFGLEWFGLDFIRYLLFFSFFLLVVVSTTSTSKLYIYKNTKKSWNSILLKLFMYSRACCCSCCSYCCICCYYCCQEALTFPSCREGNWCFCWANVVFFQQNLVLVVLVLLLTMGEPKDKNRGQLTSNYEDRKRPWWTLADCNSLFWSRKFNIVH